MKNNEIKNSFGLSCQARAYKEVTQLAELSEALLAARRDNLKTLVLGEASNVILPPKCEAMIIKMGCKGIQLLEQNKQDCRVRIGGGENWHDLVGHCLERGLFGLENLALIPGSAAAAPVQNIGAYGVELSRFLDSVEAVEIENGTLYKMQAAECGLAYRSSKFKGEWQDKFIITHITLRLRTTAAVKVEYKGLEEELRAQGVAEPSKASPQDVFAAVVSIRQRKLPDPAVNGNVGSFFQNPVVDDAHLQELKKQYPKLNAYALGNGEQRLAAASLLEALGFKGYSRKQVAMSDQHSLCMVNLGAATQQDVVELATEIKDKVKGATEIDLAIEPRIY